MNISSTSVAGLLTLILLLVPRYALSQQPANPAKGTEASAQEKAEQAAAVETDPVVTDEVAPPEGVRCGLGKSFHQGRRDQLRARLEKGILVARGMPSQRDYTQFKQDKMFWYLTGIVSPDVTLVMNFETGEEFLYVPDHSEMKERWEGVIWDAKDAWIPEISGIENLRDGKNLVDDLKKLAETEKTFFTIDYPWITTSGGSDLAAPFHRRQKKDPLDGRESREEALKKQLKDKLGVEVKSAADELLKMRMIKQSDELVALRAAARAGVVGMAEAMRSTQSGVTEAEMAALMSFVHIREGANGPAYHAIVGSGGNSCVLHYSALNRRMQQDDILLIDYGPEFDYYTTDITRTWPVNGKFTERQAEVYDIVKEAQQAGIDATKPGRTLGEITAICHAVFQKYNMQDHIRHGTSHFVGLEVHDANPLTKLEPGMVFTIEPGLYIEAESLGIRIEDVVVVTESGCEVITSDVPRNRAEIEKLILEEGWLQQMSKK
jgi:Xaa-Pro aminopeptidase